MSIESGEVHDWPPVTSAHASRGQPDATRSLAVRPVASIRSAKLTARHDGRLPRPSFRTRDGTAGPARGALMPAYLTRRHVQVRAAAATRTVRREQEDPPVGRQARLHFVVFGVDRWPDVDRHGPRRSECRACRYPDVLR